MSGYRYDGVDINSLVKSGTRTNPRYATLPGDTGAVVDSLYLIPAIGYYDNNLNPTNLAHYYMPFYVEFKSGTSYPCSTNFKHYRAIIIGGGGGGGGSGGAISGDIWAPSSEQRSGGGGGAGGAGGVYLLSSNTQITNYTFTYSIGGGGGGGVKGINNKPNNYTAAKGGGAGGASYLTINGSKYTANGGNGGKYGNMASWGNGDGTSDSPIPAATGGTGTHTGNAGGPGVLLNDGNYGNLGYTYSLNNNYGRGARGIRGTRGNVSANGNGNDGIDGESGNAGYIGIFLFRL